MQATASVVRPQDDVEELRAIVAVPGAPEATWARLPMGRILPSSDVPGPTDLMLYAVLDYRSAAAARDVLGERQATSEVLDVASEPERYDWLPQAVLAQVSDGSLSVLRYGALDRFGGADVVAFEAVPRFLLVRKVLP